ncbi:type I secretion system permease/ATPase [Grimontia marina]|uniref:Type I secretion system ATP-binding protein PrsD n=1 Tax=Grimontia marina TaxID=646534 RepID=A0A128F417_9GAMM|nr:type I secretion system permease/ATPase [Grimontia marina]CZF81509.1 Type I secretion system ATP-binding protein PrsD [Grimontia marina]
MESRNKYEKVTAETKRSLVYVALFGALVNILMLTGPIFMLQVYDRVLTSGSFSTLLGLFLIVVVLYSFMAAFDFIRSRMLSRISFKFDLELSEASFSLWMNNTSKMFHSYKPINDISTIRSFISSPTMANLYDLPWVPFYLLVVFLIHPYLGGLAMIGSLLISLLAFTNQWLTKKSNLKSIQADSVESSLLDQCFKNKQTISSLGLVGNIRSKWKELRNEGLIVLQSGIERNEVFTSISKSLRLLLQSSILALGAYLALVQEISPGMIVAASIIAGRALTPIDQVISQWKVIVKSKEAHKRLTSIYSSQSMIQEDYMDLPSPEGILEVLGVTKFRDSRDKPPILDKVSFKVNPGEAVGVIGPSASGKSTLASIVCNALAPELGEVKFDSTNSLQFDPERRLVGYLPQKVELFPGTIRDNISGFDQAETDEDVISAAVIAGVHDMIVGFSDGYNARIDSDSVNFSGGQIQRIALARAVYKLPKYLVLDEPNSNLDSEGDEALKNAISSLKSMGHTILVLTHRPSAIAAVDKILILSNGKVVEFGEKELVLKKTLKMVSQ